MALDDAHTTRRVVVLGSTGSIGMQTLEAIEHLNSLAHQGHGSMRYEVVGLAAKTSATALASQAAQFGCSLIALTDEHCPIESNATVLRGTDATVELVERTKPDLVVAAMVGAAGLPATLRAVELGINVALANKETLVAAGEVMVPAARASGAALLPIDSEHSGLWQCLQGLEPLDNQTSAAAWRRCEPPCQVGHIVSKAIITASGGPFRTTPLQEMYHASKEQALAHPTWSMGPKNTIDSATMINKGLELIEAHWLFGLSADRLGVLIHPQSIVHAMVELVDGSSLAQLSQPDMRCPIQLALSWPRRAAGCARSLDWQSMERLEFSPPERERFPAIDLAFDVIRQGGHAGAIMSGANEVAVEAFLAGSIRFGQIEQIVRQTVEATLQPTAQITLASILQADALAREEARRQCMVVS